MYELLPVNFNPGQPERRTRTGLSVLVFMRVLVKALLYV